MLELLKFLKDEADKQDAQAQIDALVDLADMQAKQIEANTGQIENVIEFVEAHAARSQADHRAIVILFVCVLLLCGLIVFLTIYHDRKIGKLERRIKALEAGKDDKASLSELRKTG